jgi:hypothetical protein
LRVQARIGESTEGKRREDAGLGGGVVSERGFKAAWMVDLSVPCKVRCGEFIGHEGHKVVLEILADAGKVYLTGDIVVGELVSVSYTRA